MNRSLLLALSILLGTLGCSKSESGGSQQLPQEPTFAAVPKEGAAAETLPSFDPSLVTVKAVMAPLSIFGNADNISLDQRARAIGVASITCLLTNGVTAELKDQNFILQVPFDFHGTVLDCPEADMTVDADFKLHQKDDPDAMELSVQHPLQQYLEEKIKHQPASSGE